MKKYLETQGLNTSIGVCRYVLEKIGPKGDNKFNLIPGILEAINSKGNYTAYGCLPSGMNYKDIASYDAIDYLDYTTYEKERSNIINSNNNNIDDFHDDLFDEVLLGHSNNVETDENRETSTEQDTPTNTNDQNESNEFLYYFVSLKSNIDIYKKISQPIIFLDGTHLKRTNQTLLTAVTITIERKLMLLAFGLYAVECSATWQNFQIHLKRSLEKEHCSTNNISFFSDMDKGLQNSIPKVFNECIPFSCAFHILKKICRKGSPLSIVMPQLILADDEEEWNKIINESLLSPTQIDKVNKYRGCSLYNIDFPKDKRNRYGYISSSPAESFNNAIYKYRQLPVHQMLIEIYNYGHQYQIDLAATNSNNPFLDYIQDIFDNANSMMTNIGHYVYDDATKAGTITVEEEYIIDYEKKLVHVNYSMKRKNWYYQGYVDRIISSSIISYIQPSSVVKPKYSIRPSGRPSSTNFANFISYYQRYKSYKMKKDMIILHSLMESIMSNEMIEQQETETDIISTNERENKKKKKPARNSRKDETDIESKKLKVIEV
ncbi:hypothetical protein WA158_004721 [Blastocystis sp. Blastoise]